MGDGYHLHPNLEELALSGSRGRSLCVPDYWLDDETKLVARAGVGCIIDGGMATQT